MAEFGTPKLNKLRRKSDLVIHLYAEQTLEFFSKDFSQEEVEDKGVRTTGILDAQLHMDGRGLRPSFSSGWFRFAEQAANLIDRHLILPTGAIEVLNPPRIRAPTSWRD